MMLQPIVEGDGDVRAAPVLLRRFVEAAGTYDVTVGRPIKLQRDKLVRQTDIDRVIRRALLNQCDAILVLFDSDDDCPAETASMVRGWSTTAAGAIPCDVVLAHREYEAWFLASIESLRGQRGIVEGAPRHPDPESPRDAKGELRSRMRAGRTYSETRDQPAFSAQFSMPQAYARSRSFRKLTKAFGDLVRAAGREIDPWPPTGWTADA